MGSLPAWPVGPLTPLSSSAVSQPCHQLTVSASLSILLPWSQPFNQTCSSVGLLTAYGLQARLWPCWKASSPSAYTLSLCTWVRVSSGYMWCVFIAHFFLTFVLSRIRLLTRVRQVAIFPFGFPFGSIPAMPPESRQVFACCIRVVTPQPTFREGALTRCIRTYSFRIGKEFTSHVILSFLAYTGSPITLRLSILLLRVDGHSVPLFGCLHGLPSLKQWQCPRLCPAGD
jgi:hypothetical protein